MDAKCSSETPVKSQRTQKTESLLTAAVITDNLIDEHAIWTDAVLTRRHLASPSHFNREMFRIVNFLAAPQFIH
jgi:hypothetical protein